MKIKAKQFLCTAFIIGSSLIFPTPVLAASEAECAIWLCLPGGFPGGCEKAHAAMHLRIKHKKPPLPPFGECAVKDQYTDPNDFSYSVVSELHIAQHEVCTRWQRALAFDVDRGEREKDVCIAKQTIPAHIIQGSSCLTYLNNIKHNLLTDSSSVCYVRHSIKVFQKGVQLGESYFFQ